MIENPDKIYPIPEKPQLSEQQITAIKGRIAEGTPWAARDKDEDVNVFAYRDKPELSSRGSYFIPTDDGVSLMDSDLYDFITFDNSPVYLPELVGESEK